MIDVLKRLAELDEANGGVKESVKMVNDPSVAVITESALEECGPMGMPGAPAPSGTPASFSINASAASGDEVANMLTQIMTLAGVKDVGPSDAGPEEPPHPLTGEPPAHGGDDIKAALAAIDQASAGAPEEEDASEPDAEITGEPSGDLGDMADQVRDMADELSGTSKEELGLESFDNTPQVQTRKTDPLNDFAQIINKVREFEYTAPNSGSNPMKAESVTTEEATVQESTGLVDLTSKLFQEYQAYKAQ